MINKVEYYDLMQLLVWKHILEPFGSMLSRKQHTPLDHLLTKKFILPDLCLHR
jgi:hypothetical protein